MPVWPAAMAEPRYGRKPLETGGAELAGARLQHGSKFAKQACLRISSYLTLRKTFVLKFPPASADN